MHTFVIGTECLIVVAVLVVVAIIIIFIVNNILLLLSLARIFYYSASLEVEMRVTIRHDFSPLNA